MTYTLARILSVAVLGAAMTACATVPGDPYYEPGYQQPGYIYGTAQPVYSTPSYPAYQAPPPAYYYGGRDRDDRWERDRNRHNNDWRERERDRDRAERERNRAERDRIAREREQDRRNQQARDADRRQREREQADRQRRDAERNRARAESRNPDGSPRTDYDRYNPSNGRWMPQADKMP